VRRRRRLRREPIRLGAQFFEQGLSIFEVGGGETLGEPVVDVGEHRAFTCSLAFLHLENHSSTGFDRRAIRRSTSIVRRHSRDAGQRTTGLTLWFTENRLVGS
jgi:hypothetical protein